MGSPTQRSLALLRKEGWEPWVVETWNQYSRVRLDLWNFGDILAMREGSPHLILQTTSYSGVSARVKKILAEPRALQWIRTGGLVVVHGWRKKLKKKGGKQMVWVPRIVEITEEMFDG